MEHKLSEGAHPSAHSSCSNSGNNSPTHPKNVNQEPKDTSTTTTTTNVHNSGNETGHVDQASKTDQAKLEGKSRPQKLIPPSRNISDFNPQQHQSPSTNKPKNPPKEPISNVIIKNKKTKSITWSKASNDSIATKIKEIVGNRK